MIDKEKLADLLASAKCAASRSYSPYSKYRVGAAVLTDAGVFTGANIENASSNLGICAERVSIACALMHDAKEIHAIAIYCLDAPVDAKGDAIAAEETLPCGACRQWLAELAPCVEIITNGISEPLNIECLLPRPFSLPKGTS